MKKSFVAALFLLQVFSKIHVQTNTTKVTFYIKGGLNHTMINGLESNGAKTGYIGTSIYGAVGVEKEIDERKFFCTGLLFSWVDDWHFIEVPLHYRQNVSNKLSVFVGPKLDLAADKFDKTKGNTSNFLGVSGEIGAQYNISFHVFTETEYSIGISRSFNDTFFDINRGRRNNCRIGVGYYF